LKRKGGRFVRRGLRGGGIPPQNVGGEEQSLQEVRKQKTAKEMGNSDTRNLRDGLENESLRKPEFAELPLENVRVDQKRGVRGRRNRDWRPGPVHFTKHRNGS